MAILASKIIGFMFQQMITGAESGQAAADDDDFFHECMSTFISR